MSLQVAIWVRYLSAHPLPISPKKSPYPFTRLARSLLLIIRELPTGDVLNVATATGAGFWHRGHPFAIAHAAMAEDIVVVSDGDNPLPLGFFSIAEGGGNVGAIGHGALEGEEWQACYVIGHWICDRAPKALVPYGIL